MGTRDVQAPLERDAMGHRNQRVHDLLQDESRYQEDRAGV
jgi:hypothetical protein